MSTRQRLRFPASLAALVLALVACGGKSSSADSSAARAADSVGLAPPVGTNQPVMDSAVAAGTARIDSLKAAGETPASGIAKGAQPAVHASANDSSKDAHKLPVRP